MERQNISIYEIMKHFMVKFDQIYRENINQSIFFFYFSLFILFSIQSPDFKIIDLNWYIISSTIATYLFSTLI